MNIHNCRCKQIDKISLKMQMDGIYWKVEMLTIDKYYTFVHPLSNTNLIYIYMFYSYMQIVLYCIVFYNNVFRFMLLLEINFILSYLILS